MDIQHSDNRNTLRDIAESLGCLTQDEVQTLTGWSDSTIEAYRKRGKGPAYIRCGKNALYPRASIAEYLASNTRERINHAKGLL
jgi:predicted DNA-binding transcriptional regulator AlpA